jgi:hypothetical protein
MTGHPCWRFDAVDAGVGDYGLIVQEGWSASTTANGGKAGARNRFVPCRRRRCIDLLGAGQEPAV